MDQLKDQLSWNKSPALWRTDTDGERADGYSSSLIDCEHSWALWITAVFPCAYMCPGNLWKCNHSSMIFNAFVWMFLTLQSFSWQDLKQTWLSSTFLLLRGGAEPRGLVWHGEAIKKEGQVEPLVPCRSLAFHYQVHPCSPKPCFWHAYFYMWVFPSLEL